MKKLTGVQVLKVVFHSKSLGPFNSWSYVLRVKILELDSRPVKQYWDTFKCSKGTVLNIMSYIFNKEVDVWNLFNFNMN